MYKIYADNKLIYHPTIPNYDITKGELTLELNTSGKLVFTIPPSNPAYGRIKLMKSIITLYDDERLLFRGRAYAPNVDLFRQDTIECEGELAFFNDSIQEPYDFGLSSVQDLLRIVLERHNQQVDTTKQFKLGRVTVTNDTQSGAVVRSFSDYLSTWTILRDKLLKGLGGYFYIRHEQDGVYLDYLQSFNLESNQRIIQNINLIDVKREWVSDDLATIIIPLGAKIKDPESDKEHYLTLNPLSLRDEEAIKLYGEITKVVHHDHITTTERLLAAGKKDLAKAKGVLSKITLTAADLSKAGEQVDSFRIGQMLQVIIPNLEINDRMLVRALSLDLLRPEQNTLSIGLEQHTLTRVQLHTEQTIETIHQNLQENIKETNAQAIVRAIREANSYIRQSADELKLEISEKYYNKEKADELLQATSTLISQMAEAIEFRFNHYQKEQTKLYGENSSRFTQLSQYIRFENGNIILGEEGNPTILRIENDRIVFIESGVESAYWHNRKFYAVDGEYLNSLKLGKFAFLPRPTGNLSFKKVGE